MPKLGVFTTVNLQILIPSFVYTSKVLFHNVFFHGITHYQFQPLNSFNYLMKSSQAIVVSWVNTVRNVRILFNDNMAYTYRKVQCITIPKEFQNFQAH